MVIVVAERKSRVYGSKPDRSVEGVHFWAEGSALIIEKPIRSLDVAKRNRGITVGSQTGRSATRIFGLKDGQGLRQLRSSNSPLVSERQHSVKIQYTTRSRARSDTSIRLAQDITIVKFTRDKTAFGQHETFPLRYGWLTKGFRAIQQNPRLFDQPEHAMVTLGIGRNMVNALRYWLEATGVARQNEQKTLPTNLGNTLLGEQGDGYLEDEATLWILHWLIASNPDKATGLYWFFNLYPSNVFQSEDVLKGLSTWVQHEAGLKRSASTLKSDVSMLLRAYAFTKSRTDDPLDSPFSTLNLIEQGGGRGLRSARMLRPYLPPVALHFAIAQRLCVDTQRVALPIRSLMYSEDGWAAPGAVFRLSEEGLMRILNLVVEQNPAQYELRDTAGLHQLYLLEPATDPLEILRRYYART